MAHFGRGRGDWVEGEYPAHWPSMVRNVVADREFALNGIWTRPEQQEALEQQEGLEEIERALHPIVTDTARQVLIRLYPEADPLLSPSRHPS